MIIFLSDTNTFSFLINFEITEKSDTGESKEDEEPEEPTEKTRKKSKDELPIDANHPDVIRIVNDVMAEAEKKESELTPEEYVEVLDEALQKRSEELIAEDPNGPMYVGTVV